MRLVESSTPGAVTAANADSLLSERLVLANAVCAELGASRGEYSARLPTAALTLLRQWIGSHYSTDGSEVLVQDGLAEMLVPAGSEGRMNQLRAATSVCSDLAIIWTAETRSEYAADSEQLRESLASWEAAARGSRWPGAGDDSPAHDV